MRRFTRQNRRKRSETVVRLRGLETLPSRIVLSGMVHLVPARAEAVPETDPPPAENGFAHHEIRDLHDMDLASLTRKLASGDGCGNDPTLHIREANRRESEELVPVAQPRDRITENDIPEEMRSRDELFGGHEFWVRGSRPWDHISQQVSGPGADSHLKALNELTPILPPAPIEQVAGPPEFNLDSFLSNVPSFGDIVNDGDTLERIKQWFRDTFGDDEEENTPEEKITPEDETPPEESWNDVEAPSWSPPVVQAEAKFWNEGMSETSGGLSTVTTHLDNK